MEIKLKDLVPSALNVRKEHLPEVISDLADSIREEGLISRIALRKAVGGKYEVLAGGKRTEAFRMMYDEEWVLPPTHYILKDVNDFEGLCLSVSENVQRTAFSTDELRDAVRIMKGLRPAITQKEIARRFLESEARIKRVVGVDKDFDDIPERVKEELRKPPEVSPGFSDGHWDVIRKNGGSEGLGESVVKDICDYIIDNDIVPSKSQIVVDKFSAKSEVTKGKDPESSSSASASGGSEGESDDMFTDKFKGELTIVEEDGVEKVFCKTKNEDLPIEFEHYKNYLKNPEKFRVFIQGKITIKPVE